MHRHQGRGAICSQIGNGKTTTDRNLCSHKQISHHQYLLYIPPWSRGQVLPYSSSMILPRVIEMYCPHIFGSLNQLSTAIK
jgi:hypothetical protein